MSDEEEESVSEGFSASEEEWKPNKDTRGGESSDDDDSDFEDAPGGGGVSGEAAGGSGAGGNRKRESEPKSRSGTKQTATAAKKRKPMGQSLRTKLYNKYRPPPKTFPSPTSSTGNNSPSASTSRTASKNGRAPNESSKTRGGNNDDDNDNDSSSDSNVEDYLVKPAELDLQSSFFDVGGLKKEGKSSPAPKFDCNAGMGNLSDSGSEDNNESSAEEHSNTKVFDFRHLLEKANSLERAKETIARRTADARTAAKTAQQSKVTGSDDVTALLALGENQNDSTSAEHGTVLREGSLDRGPQKLSKTKSTRVKRHTKSRPTSTVGGTGAGTGTGAGSGMRKGAGDGDTDDSDWEEVAGRKRK